MSLEAVIEEGATARAGYTLASFKEAGIPVYVITARIVTLDRKPLNPIEEGCLRAVEAGLETPGDICSFLGLQDVVLNSILASLNSQELVNYSRALQGGEALVALTGKGRLAISQSSLVSPQERIVKLVFDPLLRRVVFYQQSSLWKPREVKAAGRFEVPLLGSKRPEVEDIPLEDIDRVLDRLRRQNEEASELLALRRIERREMCFVPCTLLFYRSNGGQEVQVAFHLEDGLSLDHENAFRVLDGPDHIGATHVLAIDSNGHLTSELAQNADTEEKGPRLRSHESDERSKDRSPTLRTIRCHEHPPLLRDALTRSTDRMLVISPWIRDQVVDKSFLIPMEALLRSGVSVYIGYGLVEEGGKPRDKARGKLAITPRAQAELEELQAKYKNFSFRFVGNTHRKVLVSDVRFAVTTSFNWLSFRGDPKEKPRDESGTLISKTEYVEEVFRDALDLLHRGYEHPRAGNARPGDATRSS